MVCFLGVGVLSGLLSQDSIVLSSPRFVTS
jgi:hypothetical protein